MSEHRHEEALQFLLERLPARLYPLMAEHDQETVIPEFRALRRGDHPIEDPFEFVDQSLRRETRRHLLLSGAQGVGKTTFARTIAARAVSHEASEFDRALWIDCRHVGPEDTRGCWESLLSACNPQQRWLICLEGFASMLERPQGASNEPLVQTFATFPHVRLVAVVDEQQRSELFSRGSALIDLFTPLELVEPPPGTVRMILEQRLRVDSAHGTLHCEEGFLDRLLAICEAYFLNQKYPAKACQLLDHTIENARFRTTESIELLTSDLEAATEEMIGVTVRGQQVSPAEAVANAFEERVFAQPEANATCGRELDLIRAGLNEPGKPASVLMFVGTTGVGKTELAKVIAEVYSRSRKLHVYAMGNYSEPHSVSGIIGVPAGYVGHDEGGQIVNQLLADPFSVFLLDEAEKAHANVWKPFLNLFDEGWIVDQRGRKAYAEHAIFILTSNAGERTIQQMFKDEKPYDEIQQRVKETLVRFRSERSSQPVFSQQFLARINEIVVFRPLQSDAMQAITRASLEQLRQRWQQRLSISLQFDDRFVNPLAKFCESRNEASHGKEGGRIVRRVIRQEIENRLLEFLRSNPVSEQQAAHKSVSMNWLEQSESSQVDTSTLPILKLDWQHPD